MSEGKICFWQEANDKVCSCGRHYGCGEWTPEQRAAMYKLMQDKMASVTNEDQKAYLKDWEIYHGIVRYRMDIVGKNTGEFSKKNKGKDMLGPVFIPKDPEGKKWKERADIDG